MGRWNEWAGRLLHLAGAGALIAVSGTAGQAEVLQPNGKWVVDYADQACLASRAFGSDARPLLVGFRPWPLSDTVELVLVTQASGDPTPMIGQARVQIGAGAKSESRRYITWRDAKADRRLTEITLGRGPLSQLADGDAIIVRAGTVSASFAPLGLAHADAVLADCQADLLKSWGIDPLQAKDVATPPKSLIGARWISSDDYPAAAIREGNIGVTTMIYRIGLDGHASNCRVVGGSGTPVLDAAACKAVQTRGRFAPGRDATGKDVVSWDSQRVNWQMP